MSSISQTVQPRSKAGGRRQLLIAGTLGVVAAVLVLVFLNSADGDDSAPLVPTTSVVVAAEPIAAGEKITAEMLTTTEVAQTSVAADALMEESLAVDRIARYPVEKGEQISMTRLVDAPQVQALSFQIPEGKRGMTVPVSITNTPAALIAPGDFVDVIVSIEAKVLTLDNAPVSPVLGDQATTEDDDLRGAATLLQNLQVLTVQRSYVDTGVVYEPSTRGVPPEEEDDVSFVTLAVSPEEAQLLWLAQDKGKVTLVLRPFGDDQITPLPPIAEPINFLP